MMAQKTLCHAMVCLFGTLSLSIRNVAKNIPYFQSQPIRLFDMESYYITQFHLILKYIRGGPKTPKMASSGENLLKISMFTEIQLASLCYQT